MISIIVPVYNSEKYLQECLNSLSCQTVSNFEIILVDDGSTDDSGRLCDEFALMNKNSKVVHQKNSGLLLARREGMKAASGDYFMSLDSDDCLKENAIELVQEYINRYHPDIVCFDLSRAPDKSFSGTKISSGLPHGGFFKSDSYKEIKSAVCLGNFNSMANKAIKRSVACLNIDYSPYAGLMHGEDWLQLLDIVGKAESVFYIKEILYFYRISPLSSTFGFKPSQIDDLSYVFSRLIYYAEIWGSGYIHEAYCAICKHAAWLISSISRTSKTSKVDKEKYVQKVVLLVRKHCGNSLSGLIKGLRLDFRIVLGLAFANHYKSALAFAQIIQKGYSLKTGIMVFLKNSKESH